MTKMPLSAPATKPGMTDDDDDEFTIGWLAPSRFLSLSFGCCVGLLVVVVVELNNVGMAVAAESNGCAVGLVVVGGVVGLGAWLVVVGDVVVVVGTPVVGCSVIVSVGCIVVGCIVVGCTVVGCNVGCLVGCVVGSIVGCVVGNSVVLLLLHACGLQSPVRRKINSVVTAVVVPLETTE